LKKRLIFPFCVLAALIFVLFHSQVYGAGGTVSVKITKLAKDGTTVLEQKTVTYQWMRDNLPVMGDGNTHYYHQGPVFVDDPDPQTQEMLRWNPEEDQNVDTKDMGALRGTNLTVLCDLVGGMSSGDTLKVKSSDGWNRTFAYKNVLQYSSREGPMVLTWEKDGKYPDTGYTEGMRLVWFADNSTNPWGIHAFGNWDWHEAADSRYWYYYQQDGQKYPTTTGLSGMYISELIIYSQTPATGNPTSTGNPDTSTKPFWDLNGDHVCNIGDLTVLGRQWGKTGTSGWIKEDVNRDGAVDVGDIVMVGIYWGKTW